MRVKACRSISCTGTGRLLPRAGANEVVRDDSLPTTSSTSVFHSPHAGHLPTHLADSYPQLRQKNAFFNLAIAGRNGLFDEEAVNVVAVRVYQQREQDDDAEELRPFEEFIARSSPGDYFDQ